MNDERFVREELFPPYVDTEGTQGMGVGMFQMREYLRSATWGIGANDMKHYTAKS
jgi:hypothetical protein